MYQISSSEFMSLKYSDIKNFDELCIVGCEFIKGNITQHPFLPNNKSDDNLYELVGQYNWIREYLLEFNKLGFYTIMSQPGNSKAIDIYSNYYEYKKSFLANDTNINLNSNSNTNKLVGNYGIMQRAEIEGFMKYSKAMKLYSMLKNEQDIIILISGNKSNIALNSLDKYATLSYESTNDNIRFMEIESEANESIKVKVKHKNLKRDDKLKLMFHVVERYFEINKYNIKKHIPNMINFDIVGISIMDRIWNRNDYLWEKILFCLKKI